MGQYDFLQDDANEAAASRRNVKRAAYDTEAAADGGIAANTLMSNRDAYGWMPVEIATSLAKEGRGPKDKVTSKVAVASVKARKKQGFWDKDRGWWDPRQEIKRGLKATVRTSITALSVPFDVVKSGFQWSVSDMEDGESDGLFAGKVSGKAKSPLKTSPGLVALGDLLSGREVDLGSGYVPRGEIGEETLKAQRSVLIGGKAATLGRSVAVLFSDPDTKSYNTLSGIVDFSSNVGLDPMNAVGVGVAKLRDARKLLIPAKALPNAVSDGARVGDEAFEGGYKLVRLDKPGADLSASGRANGTYYSVVESSDFVSPHADDAAGAAEHFARGSKEKVLDLPEIEVTVKGREAPGGGPVPASAGVTALHSLVGPDEFSRLAQLGKKELTELLPQGRRREYADAYEVLERLGAEKARQAGYKGLLLKDSTDPNFSEFVALTDDATSPVALGDIRDAAPATQANPVTEMVKAGGILGGVKRAIEPKTAEEYIRSGKGAKFVDWAKDQTDFNAIWEGTNKKLPVELVAKLQGAKTSDEVIAELMPHLGQSVREVPKMRHRSYSRIGQMMPEGHIDTSDLDQAVTEIDRYQRLLKVPAEMRSLVNAKMAVAVTPSDKLTVATDLFKGVNASLKGGGLTTEASNKLTHLFSNSIESLRKYNVDAIGDDIVVDYATVGGKKVPTLSPHLAVETLHKDIPMPDVRELARGVGALNRQERLFGPAMSKALKGNAALTDYVLSPFMEKVWKPQVLLRGAWTLRVVGEEQIRMGAAGLDSMFHHPMSAIAYVTGRKGSMTLTDDADVLDDLDEYTNALSRRGGAHRSESAPRAGAVRSGHTVYHKGDQGYAKAWGGELAQIAQDPITRSIAQHGLDATLKRVRNGGDLAKVRGAVAKAIDEPAMNTDAGSDLWVKSLDQRLQTKTLNDPDLLKAVASRTWDGKRLFEANGGLSKAFKAELTKRADDLPAEQAFKGEVALSQESGVSSAIDNATDYLFQALMSRPSNYLSRSPAWKQTYWQRVGELSGSISPADHGKLIARATEAGLDGKQLKGMSKGTSGTLSYQDVDDLAKAYALETTKKLLYSSQAKHQWADAARIAMPFGEAWQEVLTTWTKQMVRNPANPVHNVAKTFRGAEQSGAIYEDPQSGEMRYIHPFSFFSRNWTDTVQTGSVRGLNLIGEGMPGVGPAITMPAKPLIDDDNEILYDLLWPMGKKPKFNEDPLGAMAPSHWRKIVTALKGDPDKAAELGALKMKIYEARVASGRIAAPKNAEDMYAGLEEAERSARYLMLGEGFASLLGLAPTTIKTEPLVNEAGKAGEHVPESVNGTMAAFVSADYRKFSDENYKTALDRLQDKYGDLSYLFAQSQTYSTSWGNIPYTVEAKAWKKKHADLARTHPDTFGFFAPTEGTEDLSVFQEAIADGTRKRIPGKASVLMANDKLAKAQYYKEKDDLAGPDGKLSKSATKYLQGFKEALIEDYPGAFPDDDRTPHTIPQEQAVTDLFAAAKKIKGNKTAKAVLAYEAERAEVVADLEARGITLTSKTKAAAERSYLAGFGRALVEDEPAFRNAWDFLLTKEVEDFAAETKREKAEA